MKVNYMLSYLKGMALDGFEPVLLETPEPMWLSNFTLFLEELDSPFSHDIPLSNGPSRNDKVPVKGLVDLSRDISTCVLDRLVNKYLCAY